ncbi:MAG: POTRA domain-containing protein [Melioribacter sp.]|uniref:BamA/OMP85 family outer membrane protein n=1 Tax=Rosettibacter primus TaxID=3111523 RepID=UPI00247EABBC|nr:POTRA domain-containing protein [Melioribacter sp.]
MTHQIIRTQIILYFFFCQIIFAQVVNSIEIHGNKIYTEKNYFDWAGISKGTKIYEGIDDSIKKNILSALQERGYFFADVKTILQPVDSTKINLLINIKENGPIFISNIKYNSDTKDSSHLSKIFSQLSQEIFSKEIFENAISNVLDYYENNGYPFASVKINSIYFYSDSSSKKNYVDIFLNIDKGIKGVINRIDISGNNKTKDRVILRELGLSIGDEYNQKTIDAIPGKLNKLNFFEHIEVPAYFINNRNEGVLKISVKEKVTNNFDGIIGYVPAGGKEKGYFTGFINLGFRNLFGTGRAALIRWQRENRNTQELELRYSEPWIFNFPFNLSGSMFQRIQDSTYIQRNYEGILEYLATSEISASILINSQSTIPIERKNKIFTVFNSSSITTGVNFKIDTRDDYYSTRKGILFSNAYKYTFKKIYGPKEFFTEKTKSELNLQRLEIDFEFFKELLSNQVAALKVHARELKGSDIEISDLYLLGGTSSLRGYKEKQFSGTRILWTNIEYRLLLTNKTYAFLFFDTGYISHDNSNENLSEKFKIGYGLGLNVETGIGILGVSFALAKGDSFSQGKIHFGLISGF